ncbi:hypothetical protein BLA24064_05143 [Burkholderia latens]|uniref:Uncharacterized protein n=1 Tax=Burkholderia latens TaxID=488446 RepID=A0A6P2PJR0_9BURK|nr:hypothetical protein BLA24064_05143 [Burkholderia latens]
MAFGAEEAICTLSALSFTTDVASPPYEYAHLFRHGRRKISVSRPATYYRYSVCCGCPIAPTWRAAHYRRSVWRVCGLHPRRREKRWHVFDVSGQYVGIEEAPLETPLVDPYDLILIGSAALKLVRTGFNTVSRLATGRAAVSATSKMTSRILPLLRSRLQGLPVNDCSLPRQQPSTWQTRVDLYLFTSSIWRSSMEGERPPPRRWRVYFDMKSRCPAL